MRVDELQTECVFYSNIVANAREKKCTSQVLALGDMILIPFHFLSRRPSSVIDDMLGNAMSGDGVQRMRLNFSYLPKGLMPRLQVRAPSIALWSAVCSCA